MKETPSARVSYSGFTGRVTVPRQRCADLAKFMELRQHAQAWSVELASSTPPPPVPDPDPRSEDLLQRARRGDGHALDQLFARYLPRLRRWAHGRVPSWARNSIDTGDLVQDTVLQTYRNFGAFEPRHEGALFGYLRRALLNRIRDQFRNASRRPTPLELDPDRADGGASPLDAAIDAEQHARYEAALKKLRAADRHAIVGRVELGYSYEQLALILRKPTAEAARLAVRRALLRLGEEMRR